MKIAIVCDWLVTYAGAEKLIEAIIRCYPSADLFAVVDFIPKGERDFLMNKEVKTTFVQKLPFAKKIYRQYMPLMPLAIEQLDVSQYDLILSSSHAVAKGVITGPDQIHISYVHSPMRYAWDLKNQYLKEAGLDRGIKGLIAKFILHKLRLWDASTANGVDHFIANSKFISRRIWKSYRRTSDVIYPPIDTAKFVLGNQKEEFYLTASRLVPYKKIDLIVESFAHMPDKKLVVIGSGPDLNKIKAKAKSNIEILGYQNSETLVDYMQRAKAFVFAAEEDFGLVPLEAQACGTPVIAFGKGGALETVRDLSHKNPTGVFFPEQNVKSLCQAIAFFEANQAVFTPENCSRQSAKFSPERFERNFKQFVSAKLEEVF